MSYILMPIWLFVLLAFWIIAYTVVTIYLVRKQEVNRAYLKKRIEDLAGIERDDIASIHRSLSRLDDKIVDLDGDIEELSRSFDNLKADDIQKMNDHLDSIDESISWLYNASEDADNRMDSLDAGFNLLMNDLVERGVVEVEYVDLDDVPESESHAKILPFPAQPPINLFDTVEPNEHFESGSEGSSKPCTDENS